MVRRAKVGMRTDKLTQRTAQRATLTALLAIKVEMHTDEPLSWEVADRHAQP